MARVFRLFVEEIRLVPVVVRVLPGVRGQQHLAGAEVHGQGHLRSREHMVIAHGGDHPFGYVHGVDHGDVDAPREERARGLGVDQVRETEALQQGPGGGGLAAVVHGAADDERVRLAHAVEHVGEVVLHGAHAVRLAIALLAGKTADAAGKIQVIQLDQLGLGPDRSGPLQRVLEQGDGVPVLFARTAVEGHDFHGGSPLCFGMGVVGGMVLERPDQDQRNRAARDRAHGAVRPAAGSAQVSTGDRTATERRGRASCPAPARGG